MNESESLILMCVMLRSKKGLKNILKGCRIDSEAKLKKHVNTGNAIEVINHLQSMFEHQKYAKLIAFVNKVHLTDSKLNEITSLWMAMSYLMKQ